MAANPDDPCNYILQAELKQARDGFEASEEDGLLAAALPLDEPWDLFNRAVDLDRLLEMIPGSPRPLTVRGWIVLTARR